MVHAAASEAATPLAALHTRRSRCPDRIQRTQSMNRRGPEAARRVLSLVGCRSRRPPPHPLQLRSVTSACDCQARGRYVQAALELSVVAGDRSQTLQLKPALNLATCRALRCAIGLCAVAMCARASLSATRSTCRQAKTQVEPSKRRPSLALSARVEAGGSRRQRITIDRTHDEHRGGIAVGSRKLRGTGRSARIDRLRNHSCARHTSYSASQTRRNQDLR